MKTHDAYIKSMGNYLAINGIGNPIYGFTNGKAGISLVLFSLARETDNEYFEEHAFTLLQESLLSKTKSIDFNNGLTGIGYTLIYLINKGFIESDFNQIFGDKHKYILKEISEDNSKLGALESLYFKEYQQMTKHKIKEIETIINKSTKNIKASQQASFSETFLEEYYKNLSESSDIEQSIMATMKENYLIENIRKVKIVLLDMLRKESRSPSRIIELLRIS